MAQNKNKKRNMEKGIERPAEVVLQPVKSGNPTVVYLSELEAKAVFLADVKEKSQVEISTMLNVSQPTVSRLLTSGRAKLAYALFNQAKILAPNIKQEVVRMKVAFATEKGGMDDVVAPIFGRVRSFTIIDDAGNVEIVQNPGFEAQRGAGISAAQMLISKGVNVVVAGSFGPNVAPMLAQAGIEVRQIAGKTVRDAYNEVKAGGGAGAPPSSLNTVPPGYGWGPGCGFGRRCGRRRGGRGRGRGGW